MIGRQPQRMEGLDMARGIMRLKPKEEKDLLKYLGHPNGRFVGACVDGGLVLVIDCPKVKAKHGELPELKYKGGLDEEEPRLNDVDLK
jgi:hypothetical protein